MDKIYDVVIIGAGVTGCAIARELSRYKLSVLLTDKENDISCGASRANSAIIHAGYDPEPGSLMAQLNVDGNRMTGDICEKLNVPFKRIGALVLAFNDEDMETVEKLYRNGVANGVPGVEIIGREKLRELEPNVSENAVGALLSPSAGIINPWEYTIALAENAVENGAEYKLRFETASITREKGADGNPLFTVTSAKDETVKARCIINAAGVHSEEIARLGLFGEDVELGFRTIPSKGQYFLLDKTQGTLFSRVMFQCPSKVGKGVLVSPTVHGNLIVGPDAVDVDDPDNTCTTSDALAFIRKTASLTTDTVSYRDNIRNFSGIRPNTDRGDFVIEPSPVEARFINSAGIKSPGLSSAPAIAVKVAELVKESGIELAEKESFVETREVVRFRELDNEERAKLVAEHPEFGRIICRCETITEGEILAAIHSPITPLSLDAVKRRCGAGLGRCQGGFCGPRVLELLVRELGISPNDVLKDLDGSWIVKLRDDETTN
ncbi:MAG: NAD(P)/FAD-dependent oxidoreductase [Oscillospiraceae bacterium]|nr:NAD(P)/FAD-dependent oxidoreductase [Oscillospiraceae bacterium]